MTNGLYAKAREAYLGGDLDWDADDVRVLCIDAADYTVDLATHEFKSSIPGAAIVATSGALQNKTKVGGVADADDITISSVSGDTFEALVLYKHTGVDATARLIAYIDTGYTGLPLTPNSGSITIVWPSGSDKIFKL